MHDTSIHKAVSTKLLWQGRQCCNQKLFFSPETQSSNCYRDSIARDNNEFSLSCSLTPLSSLANGLHDLSASSFIYQHTDQTNSA